MIKKINYQECPRPQFLRDSFELLDGKWDFCFDNDNSGETKEYYKGFNKEYDIVVPFSYKCKMSGINIQTRCDNVWYQKNIEINKEDNKRYILHLEGSDYHTKVFLNGKFIFDDYGAYHRIDVDLTPSVVNGTNLLVIKCEDDYSLEIPRGKQRAKDENYGCWYIDTVGIYKSVWLETVNDSYIKSCKINPNYNDSNVELSFDTFASHGFTIKASIIYNGNVISSNTNLVRGNETNIIVPIPSPLHLWDLSNPDLYDLKFELLKGSTIVDTVNSYFGLRNFEIKNGRFYLNGKELFQKLVLDQGYFIDSHLTAPSNEELCNDITKMQAFGFNGCRKHEKMEDERFLYYADVLGYIVWAEMPSMYEITANSKRTFEREWMLCVKQQYNHPCVLAWTPFNESWGIANIKTCKDTQDFVNHIYHETKRFDNKRPVITNDGWEHTISDILTIHDYTQDGNELKEKFNTLEKMTREVWINHEKGAFADGYSYNGQPIMIDEFGGTAFEKKNQKDDWGYGSAVKDDDEYIARLTCLFAKLKELPLLTGYCFTQVSDVQQEVNGLLFEDRKFKIDPSSIKKVQDN